VSKSVGLTIPSKCVAHACVVVGIGETPSTSLEPFTILEIIPILKVIFYSIGHGSNTTTKFASIFLPSLYSTLA
jgi:hypothetical protein